MRQSRWTRRWSRGGRVGLLLAGAALLLSGCSASDWERNLRFGFPTGVTKQAERIRVLWTWSGVAALALGVVVWGLIFWCCIRYRKRKGNDELPRQTKYNFLVEMICVGFPFIVIAVLFYRTVIVEDYANKTTKNPDVVVQVDAFKWNWQFEYQTYRGVEANKQETPAKQVYLDSSGKERIDPEHPSIKLPYYINTIGTSNLIPVLVLPVDQTVQIREHSLDVLHSFWVPDFLFKRDVIPYEKPGAREGEDDYDTSRDNKFEFTATKTGSYVGRCAELCGTYHSQMNFEVRVVTQERFQAYLQALKALGPDDPNRQAKALRAIGGAPYATTTYPLDTDRTDRSAAEAQGR